MKSSPITLTKSVWKNRQYYLLLLPAVVYVLIFNYGPMYGLQIAFKDFKMSLGITGSRWIGLRNFKDFFDGYYFWTLIKNTFTLSLYMLATFPIPVIVALIINELRGKYKNTVQTVLFAPHFISTVVLVGMVNILFSPTSGVVNTMLEALGHERVYFTGEPQYFRGMYVFTDVWQHMGWNAIIYIAALSGVDQGMHEAAEIDGASRLQRILYINLPSIMPTIIITFILRVGSMATIGYEKVYLMQNAMNMETAEVISTYVYKRGILNTNYSFAAAVDLFNNVINIILLLTANRISKKATDTSLF